jgi:hypothetical protein
MNMMDRHALRLRAAHPPVENSRMISHSAMRGTSINWKAPERAHKHGDTNAAAPDA